MSVKLLSNYLTFKRSSAWDLSFVLMLGIFLSTLLITELRSVPWKLFVNVCNMMATWIVFSQSNFRRQKNVFKIGHILWRSSVILLGFYIIIRLLNVYSLGSYASVQAICSQMPSLCNVITEVFFATRFYRFVTLSFSFLLMLFIWITGINFITSNPAIIRKYVSLYRRQSGISLVALGVLFLLLNQLLAMSDTMLEMSLKSWNNRQVAFLDRFVAYEYGIEHHGWIWEYGKFVRTHTPETAVLFLPPQSDVWAQEGNKYYFRWFVYPRTFTQSDNPYATIIPGSQYMLISRGGWVGGPTGWPKKPLNPACVKAVHLIDRTTLVSRQVSAGELTATLKPTEWGIIELQSGNFESCQ